MASFLGSKDVKSSLSYVEERCQSQKQTALSSTIRDMQGSNQDIFLPGDFRLATGTADWPYHVHEEPPKLKEEFPSWVEQYKLGAKESKLVLSTQVPDFGAAWSPKATYDGVKWMVQFSLWGFIIDDRFERALQNEKNLSEGFPVVEFVAIITRALLAESMDEVDVIEIPRTPHGMLARLCIEHLIEPILGVLDRVRRQILAAEVVAYFNGIMMDNKFADEDKIPTMAEYWKLRCGTFFTGFMLTPNEFAYDCILPDFVVNTPAWRQLVLAAVEHGWICNDILSCRKEVAASKTNLIVVLYTYTQDVQQALDLAVNAAKQAADNLEDAARDLTHMVEKKGVELRASEEQLREWRSGVNTYVDAMRYACTGNIEWSLTSRRYGIYKLPRDEKGNFRLFGDGKLSS